MSWCAQRGVSVVTNAFRCGGAAASYVEAIADQMKRVFTEESAKGALQAAWTTGMVARVRVCEGVLCLCVVCVLSAIAV